MSDTPSAAKAAPAASPPAQRIQAAPRALAAVQSAASFANGGAQKLLVVGSTGAGKTAQIWSLPGRKFAYIFDPAAMATLAGCPNLDVLQFLPEFPEMDATLKGFNKGSRSDRPASAKEPRVYQNWVDDINARSDAAFFAGYDWLIIDSLTFLMEAMMDRQLYINNRYGDITDMGDYRVAGNKAASLFKSITSLPLNLYCTGHLDTYQDEDTKRIVTQLRLPGRARGMLPLMFSNIWHAYTLGKDKHYIRTVPDEKGFKDIRTTIKGLAEQEDVTIKDFTRADKSGIGAILIKSGFKPQSNATAA